MSASAGDVTAEGDASEVAVTRAVPSSSAAAAAEGNGLANGAPGRSGGGRSRGGVKMVGGDELALPTSASPKKREILPNAALGRFLVSSLAAAAAAATPSSDLRLFGKPSARPFRRMGVTLSFGPESVEFHVERAKLMASKIAVV